MAHVAGLLMLCRFTIQLEEFARTLNGEVPAEGPVTRSRHRRN
jgi:hypothetical protein